MTYKKINYPRLNDLYFIYDNCNRQLRKALYQTNNNQDIKVICESAKETLHKIIQEVLNDEVVEE